MDFSTNHLPPNMNRNARENDAHNRNINITK